MSFANCLNYVAMLNNYNPNTSGENGCSIFLSKTNLRGKYSDFIFNKSIIKYDIEHLMHVNAIKLNIEFEIRDNSITEYVYDLLHKSITAKINGQILNNFLLKSVEYRRDFQEFFYMNSTTNLPLQPIGTATFSRCVTY